MATKSIRSLSISSLEKYERLIDWFKTKNSKVMVALSGGVDSALLALVSRRALGKENILTVTANYKTLADEELQIAKKIAKEIDVDHLMIEYDELENPNFVRNDKMRCFHCRNELADNLLKVAKEKQIGLIVDGSHVDDLQDDRPGMIALRQKGITSPLIEIGLNKTEIRYLAKINNLSIYDKPSNSCLASRIPHGSEVTLIKLGRIENTEYITRKALNLRNIRVRDHGDLARIEVDKEYFAKFVNAEILQQLVISIKKYGFKYVTLDLEGYRSNKDDPPIDLILDTKVST
ncbi:ATP-dependent sacrificial sulfur transferase LarE [Candidatus Nitrosocosmicus franklandus]|uniref:tRNA-specific 2-thiouridylase MnmA n=1 Tax=Candidatus Nitrosocosmicus franklandianus TaxID=1798806 RepID=A0A484IBC9_9ARCH|nr:ATP-dependent sacrificial sulfur transferase LarE [Candidatus Nitrosocosmicus franklandus]VFJ15073.1 tRNA-specific 2-thiouridylase MnmA [Candidatus Nitrosocosmicus franklandus]